MGVLTIVAMERGSCNKITSALATHVQCSAVHYYTVHACNSCAHFPTRCLNFHNSVLCDTLSNTFIESKIILVRPAVFLVIFQKLCPKKDFKFLPYLAITDFICLFQNRFTYHTYSIIVTQCLNF